VSGGQAVGSRLVAIGCFSGYRCVSVSTLKQGEAVVYLGGADAPPKISKINYNH